MRSPAFEDFYPAFCDVRMNLRAVERVRMLRWVERVALDRPSSHAPEVELVRLTDVQPIDRIAPVSEARTNDQHVVVIGRRQCPEGAGDQYRHLRAQ